MTDLKQEALVCSAESRSEESEKHRDHPPVMYCLAHLRSTREAWQREWVGHRKKTQPPDSSMPKLCLPAKKFPEREKSWKQVWYGDSRLQSSTQKPKEDCYEFRASLGYVVRSG